MNFVDFDQYYQIDTLRSNIHQLQILFNDKIYFECFIFCGLILMQLLTMLYIDSRYKKLKKRLYHAV